MEEKIKAPFKLRGTLAFILVIVIAVTLVANSIVVIDSGTVGVVSYMGAINDNVFMPGLHFKVPFVSSVIKVNVQTKKIEVASTAASRDLQVITTSVAVNYHVDQNNAANLYRNVGVGYENTIVAPAIQESLKSVIAQFSAEQLITKRQEVSLSIKQELSEKVSIYGIVTDNFNITDLDFSSEFNAAIEAKQTAQQNALKAEQDLTRIKIEAQQQVEQAKAEAEAIKATAEAEAYAIKLIQDQLAENDLYIDYRKIEKWDGKLPMVEGSSSPIIDMRDFS